MSIKQKDNIAISIKFLDKFYLEGENKHQILNSVSVDFLRSKFTAMIGKSGSGKSTILNLISGIDTIDGGEVIIDGIDVSKLADKERTIFRRDKIGIIFQFFNLIPTLTVIENITLPQELMGRKKSEYLDYSLSLLERVGLKSRANAYPDKLSGGEQQRVAIARALSHNPSLILADEPTGNLDNDTGKIVLDLLLELSRESGKTLIMATHSTDIIPFADEVFSMQKGSLVKVSKV